MKKDREFYKKRAEDLANDNIRLITDNVSLKIENKELKEQSKLFGVGISKAEEYAEFIIMSDRKGLPLISLEDYIKHY